MKKLLPVFLLFIFITGFSQENEGIQFVEEKTLEEVLSIAEQESKLVFMVCYTTWCGSCKFLSKNILPKREAGDYFKKHFISVKYDMDKPENKVILEKYDVKGFPTLLFLNNKGEVVFKNMGAPQQASALVDLGKKALNPENDYRKMMAEMKNATIQTKLSPEIIQQYLSIEYPENPAYWLSKYLDAIPDDSTYTTTTLRMIASFSEGQQMKYLQYLIQHEDSFKNHIGKDQPVNDVISSLMTRAIMNYHFIKNMDHPMVKPALLQSDYYQSMNSFRQYSDSAECWNKFITIADKYLLQDKIHNMELNNIAWMVYENYKKFNDEKAFQIGMQWAKKSVELEENMYNLDTYAAFLFEEGEIQKAYELQQEAYELIQKDGPEGHIKAYKKRLDKYREALKEAGKI